MHASRQSIGSGILLFAALSMTACEDRGPSNKQDIPAPVSVETGPVQGSNSAAKADESPAPPQAQTSDAAACHAQDGRPIAPAQLRAIGTEPFWNARIDGRCMTYSTPEDQAGTRVWTRFAGDADNGTWSGALNGRQFELRTRKSPGCSDGMSDNRYPLAVTLRVGGETRQGCAQPA